MMPIRLAVLLASLLAPLAAQDGAKKAKIGKIEWFTGYDEALKEAKKQNKALWLHFGENPG